MMNRQVSVLLVFFFAVSMTAPSHSEMVEYSFRGTISEKDDPHGYFTDTMLGNAIHGLLRYDTGVEGFGVPAFFSYFHTPPFLGIAFRENTNEFQADPNADSDNTLAAIVGNNFGNVDSLTFSQRALLPNNIVEELQEIRLEFIGAKTVLADTSLPAEIQPDVWNSITVSLVTTSTTIEGSVDSIQPLQTGDFNFNGELDAEDIDILSAGVKDGTNDLLFDFDLHVDSTVDVKDREIWVNEIKNTYFGDSNLDGEFNTADFVAVFQAGEYEDGVLQNSGWETGDWNGDMEFDTSDFVIAFQSGGFEMGPRTEVVPEPAGGVWMFLLCWVTASIAFPNSHRIRLSLQKNLSQLDCGSPTNRVRLVETR